MPYVYRFSDGTFLGSHLATTDLSEAYIAPKAKVIAKIAQWRHRWVGHILNGTENASANAKKRGAMRKVKVELE